MQVVVVEAGRNDGTAQGSGGPGGGGKVTTSTNGGSGTVNRRRRWRFWRTSGELIIIRFRRIRYSYC
jgi:hypothetical protein